MRLAVTVAVTVAFALGAAVGCGGPQTKPDRGLPVYLELTGLDGERVRVRELRGKPAVLHLFTVGSMAAQMDVSQLNAAHDAGEVAVLGIGLDPNAEVLIRAWAQESGARYRVAIGDEDLTMGKTDLGSIAAVPTTILLDDEGLVIYRTNAQLRPGELERALGSK